MKPIFSLCVIAFALSACSSYSSVKSESYDDSQLASYHTFRVVTPEEGVLPITMTELVYEALDSTIVNEMKAHGFVEDDNSRLVVNIGLTVHRTSSGKPNASAVFSSAAGPYYDGVYPMFIVPRKNYYNYYDGSDDGAIYKEGMLTLDFVDIDNHELVYSASVPTISEDENALAPASPLLNKTIARLFVNIPVVK